MGGLVGAGGSRAARSFLAILVIAAVASQATGLGGAEEARQPAGSDRDVVFALDASGSMRLEKFDSVKYAFENMTRALGTSDRFTVFTFSAPPDWWINMWSQSLQPATDTSAAAARSFVDGSGTSGSSNIVSAM